MLGNGTGLSAQGIESGRIASVTAHAADGRWLTSWLTCFFVVSFRLTDSPPARAGAWGLASASGRLDVHGGDEVDEHVDHRVLVGVELSPVAPKAAATRAAAAAARVAVLVIRNFFLHRSLRSEAQEDALGRRSGRGGLGSQLLRRRAGRVRPLHAAGGTSRHEGACNPSVSHCSRSPRTRCKRNRKGSAHVRWISSRRTWPASPGGTPRWPAPPRSSPPSCAPCALPDPAIATHH